MLCGKKFFNFDIFYVMTVVVLILFPYIWEGMELEIGFDKTFN